MWRIGDQSHLERSYQSDELSAAVAEADDSERSTGDLVAQHFRLPVPAAGPGGVVLLEQTLGKSQHEEECRGCG